MNRGRIVAIGLSAVLSFAAIALGSAHGATSAGIQIAIWVAATAWFSVRPTRGDSAVQAVVPRSVIGSGALLLLYLGLQSVPLPRSALEVVSPNTADLYRRTVDSIPVPQNARPIANVGAPDRQPVSVEDRTRIRDLASSPTEGEWRPIALYPFAARGDWLRYLAYGLVLWMAASITAPRALLGGVAFAGIAVATIGLVQRATWNGRILWMFDRLEGPPLAEETRVLGTFVNPDHFAAFVAMALFPAWGLAGELLKEGRRRDSTSSSVAGVVLMVGCGVIVAALVGSASRGALLGTLGGAAVWLVLSFQRPSAKDSASAPTGKPLHWALRVAPAALGIVIVGLGFGFAGASGRGTLDRRLASGADSLAFRLDLWSQSLGMLRDFPIFGVGAGGWREVFLRYERYPLTWMRPNHAHNDYLEWASEVGAIGLLLTIVLAATWVRWAASNRSIPSRLRWPLLGGLVVIAIHSIGDFSLRAGANALLASILLGLLCNRQWRREIRPRPIPAARFGRAGFVAAAIALVLSVGSALNLRESVEWARLREGATSLSRAPQDASSWEEVGVQLYRTGYRYQPPTSEAFRAAIDRRPTAERSYWLLALASPRSADRARALEAALVLHPSAALWRVEYAKLLERTGRADEALAEIERAAYLDPRVEQQGYVRGGRVQLAPAVAEAAERGFLRAMAEHPGDPLLHVEIAAFYEATRNVEKAAQSWREAAVATGDWTQYGTRAAEVFLKAGDTGRAETALRELMAKAPRFEGGYRRLALEVLLPARRFDDAAIVIRSGIDRTLDPALLQVALATVETARGNPEDSRVALQRAEASGRWQPEVQYLIGKEYLQVGDLDRASKAFGRALELEPAVARYAFLLGQTREQMYDLEGALDAYRRAAKLEPRDEVLRKRVERIEQLASAAESEKARQ